MPLWVSQTLNMPTCHYLYKSNFVYKIKLMLAAELSIKSKTRTYHKFVHYINIIMISFAEGCLYDGEEYDELSMIPVNQTEPCEVCHCFVRTVYSMTNPFYNLFTEWRNHL